jgi:trehalose 6-phosphate synthase
VGAGGRRKLIVVSNRGPVSYYRDEAGERLARRGAGGLVTALSGLLAHHDVTWIASAMSDEDHAVAAESAGAAVDETGRDGSPYRLHLVSHDPAAYDAFYNVVANPTLWFVQHYLWDLVHEPTLEGRLREAWETGYVTVNRAFAEAVLTELEREPGATVWFQDYHLYVAPRLVRDLRPDARLAHFVHIPWAQPDYWGVLPAEMRWAIHDGLLANDVVSFHTQRWRRSFLRACEDFVGAEPDYGTMERVTYGDRDVLVTARPISVDPDEFDEVARSEEVLTAERSFAERRPELLVLRVDRTDPSKNVVRGFRAFELCLEAHPELHGRVGMLALLTPSRQDIRHYAAYAREIEESAERVNTRFGRDGWQPIELHIVDDFPQAVAAYKQFDVLLVNAIFDGLNLVAKEAPLVNERGGVVVLSENAGAHEELAEWVVTVNPFDVAEQADALHEALTMPEAERRRRLEAICTHVREHTLAEWAWLQMEDLARGAELRSPE